MDNLLERTGTIYLPVTDLAASVRWYEDKLGFTLFEMREHSAEFQVYRGAIRLELVQHDGSAETFRPLAYIDEYSHTVHFNVMTPNARFVHDYLAERNVQVTDVMDYGPIIVFDIIDPDGNCIGVVQEKADENNPFYRKYEELYPHVQEKGLFDGIGGSFMPVTDLERSIAWYVDKLGVELIDNWGTGAGLLFTGEQSAGGFGFIHSNDFQTFTFVDSKRQVPYYDSIAADLAAAHRILKERGIEVTDIVDDGRVQRFSLRDPDGHVIGVRSAG